MIHISYSLRPDKRDVKTAYIQAEEVDKFLKYWNAYLIES